MVELHLKNLSKLCRVCGNTFTDDKVHNISAIKVKPKVKNELFEADETDVHPKKICQTCNRKVDGIDKAYRASLKNKTRYGEYNFDKEKEKMATFDKHTSDCMPESMVYQPMSLNFYRVVLKMQPFKCGWTFTTM